MTWTTQPSQPANAVPASSILNTVIQKINGGSRTVIVQVKNGPAAFADIDDVKSGAF